jgi:hypothetical protein
MARVAGRVLSLSVAGGFLLVTITRSMDHDMLYISSPQLSLQSVVLIDLLQRRPAAADLARRHRLFLADALAPHSSAPYLPAPAPDPPSSTALTRLRRLLRLLWKIPWESRHKEALWRLAVNGIHHFPAHAADLAAGRIVTCPCGAAMTRGDRLHHFWDCCVSHALRDTVPILIIRQP